MSLNSSNCLSPHDVPLYSHQNLENSRGGMIVEVRAKYMY